MDQNYTIDSNLTEQNVTNNTFVPWLYAIDPGDTNWIITSSFMIFSMQTGFGMLESGCVSVKNEVNIMMKNVADIVLGGLTYWAFGFALSFGRSSYSNPFIAFGDFFIDPSIKDPMKGAIYSAFIFQMSFATTATTIVSGAMAERCNFKAYCLFSLLNTVVYCIPAGWVWGDHGFLKKLGAVDIAGSGPVHLIGGSSAFASAIMLGPRFGRYDKGLDPLPLGSPVNAVMGLFVLWWGWLAFNSGSTYGLSGAKWEYAARAAVMTMIASFGGGCFSLAYSLCRHKGRLDVLDIINGVLAALVAITAGCFLYVGWEALLVGTIGAALACFTMPLIDRLGVDDPVGATSVHGIGGMWGAKWEYAARAAVMTMIASFGGGCFSLAYSLCRHKGRLDVLDIINGVLAALVAITAGCFLYVGWEALLVGTIGAALACFTMPLIDRLGVDDPVGATSVHGIGGMWGVIAVGLFAQDPVPLGTTYGREGLFRGGGWYLLGIQTLTCICLIAWSMLTSFALLWFINKIVSIRMDLTHELMGADMTEHFLRHGQAGVSRAMSALRLHVDVSDMDKIDHIGSNPAHDNQIENMKIMMARKRNIRFSKVLKNITKGRNFGINLPKNLFPKRKKKVDEKEKKNNHENVTINATIHELAKKTVPSISITTSDKPPQFAWID